MHVRQNILNLSARDLKTVREGFEGLQAYPFDDKRGFLYWAGRHGYPDFECPHHRSSFLTWHRAYLRAFELAMQDVTGNYDVGLPYWDWTTAATGTDGIPEVLTAETYGTGANPKPNPLLKARILFPPNVDQETTRSPAPTNVLNAARAAVVTAEGKDSFLDFQRELENGHDGLHGWVGGSMGQINIAAFDPIFWFHHANVDRLWARWQDLHPSVNVPEAILAEPLTGLSLDGRDVISYRGLGYEYAASAASSPVAAEVDALQGSSDPLRKRFSIAAGDVGDAELVMTQVQHPTDTLEIRIFLDAHADATTPVDGNPACASVRFVFGHGECMGADEGHCDWRKPRPVLDPRGQHHLQPYELRLDVTEAVKAVVGGRRRRVDVSVVVVDMAGDPVPADALVFDELALISRE